MYFSPGMYPRVVNMSLLNDLSGASGMAGDSGPSVKRSTNQTATAQEPDPGFCGSPDKASASVASRKRAIWVFLAAVMVGGALIYKFMGPV